MYNIICFIVYHYFEYSNYFLVIIFSNSLGAGIAALGIKLINIYYLFKLFIIYNIIYIIYLYLVAIILKNKFVEQLLSSFHIRSNVPHIKAICYAIPPIVDSELSIQLSKDNLIVSVVK